MVIYVNSAVGAGLQSDHLQIPVIVDVGQGRAVEPAPAPDADVFHRPAIHNGAIVVIGKDPGYVFEGVGPDIGKHDFTIPITVEIAHHG